MKAKFKIFLILSAFMVAFSSAQAALVVSDGEFEGIAITQAANNTNFTEGIATNEWWSTPQGGNFPANDWDISNDGDDFAESDGRFGKALYQRVTGGGSGLYDLDFEYQKVTSGFLRVAVWGFNSGGSFSIDHGGFGLATSFGDATHLASVEYTVDTAGWTADTLSFDLGGTGYDSVIIGFATNVSSSGGAGNLGAVDSVSLSVIPEPSTFAMMGLAGLASIFLYRRRR